MGLYFTDQKVRIGETRSNEFTIQKSKENLPSTQFTNKSKWDMGRV